MTLIQLALSAFQRSLPNRQQAEDAYLAAAVDIYDLERRMEQLDKRDSEEPLHLRHWH